MSEGDTLTLQEKCKLCSDVSNGLNALHDCDIVHGDVKPANILIFRDPHFKLVAKISDFGFSLMFSSTNKPVHTGTFRWAAPEVGDSGISVASDIYSFGLVVWYILLGGNDPFRRQSDDNVGAEKADGDKLLTSALRVCPTQSYKYILQSALQLDPQTRHSNILGEVPSLLEENHDQSVRDDDEYNPLFSCSLMISETTKYPWYKR